MRVTFFFLISLLMISCSGSEPKRTETDSFANTNRADNLKTSANIAGESKSQAELQKSFEEIAKSSKGKVGVMAMLLETGETVALNAKDHFPMQSFYKFPIGMAVLRQVDEGKLKLDQNIKIAKSEYVREGQHSPLRDANPDGAELPISEILRLAVSESDGTASDVLLRVAGGAGAVDKYLKEIGITEINIADTEKAIGSDWETQYRNWASPEGAVSLLRALHEKRGLSTESQSLLVKLMTETPTGKKRLKDLLPAGTIVVHKTGTSGQRNGITAATNDVGNITLPNSKHIAIAVFVSDSPADETVREETIARIAFAAWEYWK